MPPDLRKFRTTLLGISLAETTFAKRGFFVGDTCAKQKLERSGQAFVTGYNSALEHSNQPMLVTKLEGIEADMRGFAFEGAAMGLAVLDYFSPWKKRLLSFMAGAGSAHIYMLHVGLGWTFGRLPRRRDALLSQFHPLFRWLALDGYGFHEGYFSWRRMFGSKEYPRHLKEYERRAFDQGLGRSLWFVEGATISRIATTIAAFPSSRQPDLWSGTGLACAYAGGVQQTDLQQLCEYSGIHRPHLAQGVAFAAKARQRADNLVAHTELACQVICGLSADEAANITDSALKDLPQAQAEPEYELWRQRIRAYFTVPVRS